MNKGFTLLEILLAIAILSFVGALIYGGFAQTSLNKERVEDDIDHSRIVHTALQRMGRELSMAFISTHVNADPQLQASKTVFIGTDRLNGDRIDFNSFSHRRLYRNAHESDQNSISYFVTQHPDDPDLQVLARREENRIDEDPLRGGKSLILIEGVEELDIEYLDPLSKQWVKSWDSTDPAGQLNRLPTQVRIRIAVRDPRRPGRVEEFGTRVMIPLTFALNHANYNP
jgi:general secretion pathway protein J